MKRGSCVFCNDQINNQVVWTNNKVKVIVPNRPINSSHLVIFPSRHILSSSVDPLEVWQLIEAAKKIMKHLHIQNFTIKSNFIQKTKDRDHILHLHLHVFTLLKNKPRKQPLFLTLEKIRKMKKLFFSLE